MNPDDAQAPVDRAVDILATVRMKGVKLWSENGQLYYRAPKGSLTQEEIDGLRIWKGDIIAHLEIAAGPNSAGRRLAASPQTSRAPLAFSQLAHWNAYRLGERHAIRQVASATRLVGQLKYDVLQDSIDAIVRRQHALRTRIVVFGGAPIQEICESGSYSLELDDLTSISERLLEFEIKRQIDRFILAPIDVAVDPLFGARLLKLRDDEHVLIVVMEHMISDAFSLNILVRDIFAAYKQVMRGRDPSLPQVLMQFADYALWQRAAQKSWMNEHGEYWNMRLAGCHRVRFPNDQSLSTGYHSGWTTVPLWIGRDLKKELLERCRARQTTLAMSVFTAFVGLILRWCDVSEAIIQYATDGRNNQKIENTIGFFASALYLRIELSGCDRFVDLLERVTGEYCRAYEHADSSYMAAQLPRPEFTRNTTFNWVPQESMTELSDLDGSEAITALPIRFVHPMLKSLEMDNEPSILLFDTDDEIVGDVYFPVGRFSIRTMERFGSNFMAFIVALLRRPEERVSAIPLL